MINDSLFYCIFYTRLKTNKLSRFIRIGTLQPRTVNYFTANNKKYDVINALNHRSRKNLNL